MRDLSKLKAAQFEDARGHRWAHAIQVWAKRWTKTLKAVGALVLVASGVMSGVSIGAAKLYRAARKVYGAVTLMRARNIAPAELPATGVASTFADRVDKPKAP